MPPPLVPGFESRRAEILNLFQKKEEKNHLLRECLDPWVGTIRRASRREKKGLQFSREKNARHYA